MADTGTPLASVDPRVTERLAGNERQRGRRVCLRHEEKAVAVTSAGQQMMGARQQPADARGREEEAVVEADGQKT